MFVAMYCIFHGAVAALDWGVFHLDFLVNYIFLAVESGQS